MNTLAQLHADIDTRVHTIQDDNSDWQCGLGCDGCCQRLAEIPLLTAAEWDWLKEGLAALPPELLREIGQDIARWPTSYLAPLSARCWISRREHAGSMATVR